MAQEKDNKIQHTEESLAKTKEEKQDETGRVVEEEAMKLGLMRRGVSSWKGPLPPQVIEKISPKVADEMVQSLCRRQERQDDIVEKLIDSKRESDKEIRKSQQIQLLIGCVFFIIVLVICFLFKNTEILFKLIDIGIYLVGGGGVAIIFLHKKSKTEDDLPKIEFE